MKKGTLIRKANKNEVDELANLWLKTSLIAHDFIPEKYWIGNRKLMVENYLPNADVYVAESNGYILGFVALVGGHIASVFVDNEQQGKGIGSLLLDYAKKLRTEITLSVYQKNVKSVNFYLSKDFTIQLETLDEPTGEKEFTMKWIKS